MFITRYVSLFFTTIFVLTSIIFSKDISLKSKGDFKSVLGIKNIDKTKIIESIYAEDFPTTSTFYQLNQDMDIEAYSSYQESNPEIIDLSVEDFLISSGYEMGDNSIFPKNNLIISEPQIFRGLVVRHITFIPFTYNIQTKELVVLEDILDRF